MPDEHAGPRPAPQARPSVRLLLPRPEGPADPHLELEVPVETDAVDGLPNRLHHRGRDVEVVDLEDQVPGPRMPVRADLEDVVAERGDHARPELLPLGEH